MNHKRKHRRHHSSCSLCKPNKTGHEDRRTIREIRQDIADNRDLDIKIKHRTIY